MVAIMIAMIAINTLKHFDARGVGWLPAISNGQYLFVSFDAVVLESKELIIGASEY
jgi:hypothetical protein